MSIKRLRQNHRLQNILRKQTHRTSLYTYTQTHDIPALAGNKGVVAAARRCDPRTLSVSNSTQTQFALTHDNRHGVQPFKSSPSRPHPSALVLSLSLTIGIYFSLSISPRDTGRREPRPHYRFSHLSVLVLSHTHIHTARIPSARAHRMFSIYTRTHAHAHGERFRASARRRPAHTAAAAAAATAAVASAACCVSFSSRENNSFAPLPVSLFPEAFSSLYPSLRLLLSTFPCVTLSFVREDIVTETVRARVCVYREKEKESSGDGENAVLCLDFLSARTTTQVESPEETEKDTYIIHTTRDEQL